MNAKLMFPLLFACMLVAVQFAVAEPPAGEEKQSAPTKEETKALQEQFDAFVKSPTRKNFLAVRKVIVSSKQYSAYSNEMRKASELIDNKEYEKAEQVLNASSPNLLLSPQAHFLLAAIAQGKGDAKQAAKERAAAKACIEGVLSTGDGSKAKPYLVLRTSDEYDLLNHLGKRSMQQGLHRVDDKSFDVLTTTDGAEIWFDITDAFNSLSRSLRK